MVDTGLLVVTLTELELLTLLTLELLLELLLELTDTLSDLGTNPRDSCGTCILARGFSISCSLISGDGLARLNKPLGVMADSRDLGVVVLSTGSVSDDSGDSVVLCLALCVGDGILMGDLDTVTGDLGTVTLPPRENDLTVAVDTLGTVGTLLSGTGVVNDDRVGRSGTAGTGCSTGGRTVPTLATGRDGTAATGSGRIFCTGAIRAADLGVSRNDPR